MALSAKLAPMGSGKQFKIDLMEIGSYPTRLVGIVDCGLQPQSYEGEEKAPKREVAFTYEFVDVFLKDEDGEDVPDKPRWLSEQMPLNNIESEKAKSTIRYKAFDPANIHDGDFVKCLGTPLTVTVGHNPSRKDPKRIFERIMGVATMRAKDAEKCPKLINEAFVFDLEEPDMAVFLKLPKFLQERVKSNLEFNGSKLDAMLKKDTPPKAASSETPTPPKSKLSAELDEEQPY